MNKYEHLDCDNEFPTKSDREKIENLYGPKVRLISRIYKYYNFGYRRVFVVVNDGNNRRLTINYAKYLLECKLKRHIRKGYIAHHRDNNTLNDNIWNLEEKWESKHVRDHNIGVKLGVNKMKRCYRCTVCNEKKYISSEFLIKNVLSKAKKYGYFCSEHCYKVFCRKARNGIADESYHFSLNKR